MANFDLSMNNFLVPGLRNYQPKVGKMKSLGVSLTTLEVVNNMATPYTRVFTMTDGDTVSGPVEADCTVIYRTTVNQQLDLTSLKGSPGVKINFILEGTGSLELVLTSGLQQTTYTLTPQASIAQVYTLNSGGVQTGWVVGSGGSGGSGSGGSSGGDDTSNTYHYTFVVDSDEALANWANNDTSKGQDYTSVLIRKDEWTSTVGVNLTATGTKIVVGEAGSKLVFNNVEKGLYYDDAPSTPDYYMQGVNVEVTKDNWSGAKAYGFYNCINLTNCAGTGTGISGTVARVYGFANCTNLTNCAGTGIGNSISDYVAVLSYGFNDCTNLTNCTGTATAVAVASEATLSSDCYGFNNCTNLTNCTGTGTGTGTVASGGNGFGFTNCTNLTSCTGTGTGTTDGYGFILCVAVSRCNAGAHCTKGVFINSYASSDHNDTYECADTADGGFNDTTNPAA